MSLYTTDQDTCFGEDPSIGETLEDTINFLVHGTEIEAEVVDPAGPGGGWPVVRFTGPEAELRGMLIDNYGFAVDEVDDFIYPV